MELLTITEPTVEPVTLATVYLHLRLDADENSPADSHPDDSMLNQFIAASRKQAEKITRRSFVSQGLRLVTNAFPTDRGVVLLRPPILEVTSVSYYDADNALQVIDPANYFLTAGDKKPKLQFLDTYAYPALYGREDALRIEYTAGYEPSDASPADYAANVPGGIKAAILIGVQLLYDEMTPEKRISLERARDALLHDFKVYLSP
jgi:uncharacterized phiE125 gp8 family phage protein